jgi:hypothetical protein
VLSKPPEDRPVEERLDIDVSNFTIAKDHAHDVRIER